MMIFSSGGFSRDSTGVSRRVRDGLERWNGMRSASEREKRSSVDGGLVSGENGVDG